MSEYTSHVSEHTSPPTPSSDTVPARRCRRYIRTGVRAAWISQPDVLLDVSENSFGREVKSIRTRCRRPNRLSRQRSVFVNRGRGPGAPGPSHLLVWVLSWLGALGTDVVGNWGEGSQPRVDCGWLISGGYGLSGRLTVARRPEGPANPGSKQIIKSIPRPGKLLLRLCRCHRGYSWPAEPNLAGHRGVTCQTVFQQ